MTPTRALIEAAEVINKARKSDPTQRFTGKIWDTFEAAISSAKAAEEGECPNCGAKGIEECHNTEWPARFVARHKGRGLSELLDRLVNAKHLLDTKAIDEGDFSGFAEEIADEVISVREKEGTGGK